MTEGKKVSKCRWTIIVPIVVVLLILVVAGIGVLTTHVSPDVGITNAKYKQANGQSYWEITVSVYNRSFLPISLRKIDLEGVSTNSLVFKKKFSTDKSVGSRQVAKVLFQLVPEKNTETQSLVATCEGGTRVQVTLKVKTEYVFLSQYKVDLLFKPAYLLTCKL